MVGKADSPTSALVRSGGGAKGAYEVGVMKALFAGASAATGHRPLTVQVYTGTSVGAYNAAFMASQTEVTDVVAAGLLEDIWRERIADHPGGCGNGVFRLRATPLQLAQPGCWRNPLQLAADTARDAVFWTRYALTRGAELAQSQDPILERLLDTVDLAALFSREPLRSLIADTIDLGRLRASPKTLTILASDWKFAVAREFSKVDVADRFGDNAILASTPIPRIFLPQPIHA